MYPQTWPWGTSEKDARESPCKAHSKFHPPEMGGKRCLEGPVLPMKRPPPPGGHSVHSLQGELAVAGGAGEAVHTPGLVESRHHCEGQMQTLLAGLAYDQLCAVKASWACSRCGGREGTGTEKPYRLLQSHGCSCSRRPRRAAEENVKGEPKHQRGPQGPAPPHGCSQAQTIMT